MNLRLLECYTLDLDAVTQFFPGEYTREKIEEIKERLEQAETPEERWAIKVENNVQRLEPGDALVLKGPYFDEKNIKLYDQLLQCGSDDYEGDVFRVLTQP